MNITEKEIEIKAFKMILNITYNMRNKIKAVLNEILFFTYHIGTNPKA